jgi:hypothetical protein
MYKKLSVKFLPRINKACHICGTLEHEHHKRHSFIPVSDELKCAKCERYFYQHQHISTDCIYRKKV